MFNDWCMCMVTWLGCHNIQISYDGIWFPDKYWILKEFLNKDQIIRLSINTLVFYMNLFFNVWLEWKEIKSVFTFFLNTSSCLLFMLNKHHVLVDKKILASIENSLLIMYTIQLCEWNMKINSSWGGGLKFFVAVVGEDQCPMLKRKTRFLCSSWRVLSYSWGGHN